MLERSPRAALAMAWPTSLALVCVGAMITAQPTASPSSELPAFSAASIKRNWLPNLVQPSRTRFSPGRFTATNSTVRQLVRFAFDTTVDAQIVGGPSWVATTAFDVTATTGDASRDQVSLMVQRMLIERFQLIARTEDRPLPVYRLVTARQDRRLGPAMSPSNCPPSGSDSAPRECGVLFLGPNRFHGKGLALSRIASGMVSEITDVDRFVIDDSGLSGLYDVTVWFTPSRAPFGLRVEQNPDWPQFATALREQTGLRLVPGTAPVRVVVIERANMPSAD